MRSPPTTAAHPASSFAWLLGSALIALSTGCGPRPSSAAPTILQRSLRESVAAPTRVTPRYDPARDLGSLFHDVQLSGIYPDSKTFVDARALDDPARIVEQYVAARSTPGFDLAHFVATRFEPPRGAPSPTPIAPLGIAEITMEQHIRALWPALTRTADVDDPRSTLLPLSEPYVVPGGRFREIYYWDSYFTMIGLLESGRLDLVAHMLDNFAELIRTVGHIPNGNRSYYLSRSQPPFFAAMVTLYAGATDSKRALAYLDAMEVEHAFWMDGVERLRGGDAYRRVVKLTNGATLNRYWDDRAEPRPESYRADVELGLRVEPSRREALYRNVRAAAESGWDFSSRWMRDPADLRTLETIDLVPVDLNSLLVHAERTIAQLRRARAHAGDVATAEKFEAAAAARTTALRSASYDERTGFFYDVRYRSGEKVLDRPSMAAAAALYFDVATRAEGEAVVVRLERDFIKPGGFVTTLITSGQQWDAPNGWPPLQWMAIQGVAGYGGTALAQKAREQWLDLARRTYRSTGKMMEKYDVIDLQRPAGGGEYPTQDGFGWSNGVVLGLASHVQPRGRPPSK